MLRLTQMETRGPPDASSPRTVDLMRAVWTGENIRVASAFAVLPEKITLFPNAPGQPMATARTGNVDFSGQQTVVLVLDVPYVQGSPVVFEVEVLRPDGSVALAARASVGAGRRRTLRAAAPEPLHGPHMIVLRTLLLPPGNTAWTWAHVLSFAVVPPGAETDAEDGELPAVRLLGPAAAEAPSCLVCGGRTFGRAQSGRLSRLGNQPRCLTCGSVERHRIVRSVFDAIPGDQLAAARALQFSPETVVQPASFASFEVSVYGGYNSLDLMRIDRPDASYDWVLANHVLEHVPDDATALKEILRILAPDGIAVITVPDTYWQFETEDWGFADPNRNEHYREYGSDFPRVIGQEVTDCRISQIIGQDPVTGIRDIVYLASRTLRPLESVAQHCRAAGLIAIVGW